MSSRDGKPELPVESPELSAGQDGELRRLGAGLRSRSPLIGAELDGRIMARIRRGPRARLLAARAWWLRPRQIRLSPLHALLGAGALTALVLIGIRQVEGDGFRESALSAAVESDLSPSQKIQFVLAAPGASRVNLVGDFNGWDSAATPLQAVGAAGVWSVEVGLPSGRHEYAFVIDGREWRPDPAAPQALANEYGMPNSVITVGAQRL